MSIQELISVSRRYGADPAYVVAGGGNTSWKTADALYIKGSGAALETITADGFVKMDRRRLAAIWTSSYPGDPDERESAVLADMMAARFPGEENKRPSVETLLHDLLPSAYVVHTHPSLINGITCSVRGEAAATELFGDDCLWIPSTNPGYILSRTVKDAWAAHVSRAGQKPAFILLQNHGIFVNADRVAEVDAIYQKVTEKIQARIIRQADFSPLALDASTGSAAAEAARLLSTLAADNGKPASIQFALDAELARLCASREAFAPVALPFSPDHIVYAGSDFLFADGPGNELEQAYKDFVQSFGRKPKLAAIRGLGVFGIGGNGKSAALAVDLFRDAAKVAAYTEAFGGPKYMSPDQVAFINDWEVERYRSKISTGA
ncbi:MAG: class II aldolase/adducin family protein [Clostridia bacterium]|jgi:rhamnose utilization protein RhaD (predicted bifunctional aldolase and dehydrogenase)